VVQAFCACSIGMPHAEIIAVAALPNAGLII